MTLPPGRLRLVTSPSRTGSPPDSKTIGMVEVAAFAASAQLNVVVAPKRLELLHELLPTVTVMAILIGT